VAVCVAAVSGCIFLHSKAAIVFDRCNPPEIGTVQNDEADQIGTVLEVNSSGLFIIAIIVGDNVCLIKNFADMKKPLYAELGNKC
jgi:hypothetical protein